MEAIYNKVFLEHDTGMHPENKKRLEFLNLKNTKIPSGEKYLSLIHTKDYISKVKRYCKQNKALDSDTLTSKNSYKAATFAVGATIKASESNDFAVVRPPGHHAYPNKASGFCIFNNLAISVQKLVNEGKKVLIIDFDGHLGNGTEKIFYDSNQVFYFSIHQYPAFPNKGWVDELGEKKGKGYTLNVPIPPKSGDDIFLESIKKYLPILKKFNADIVALSAGFDSYQGDLLLDLKVSINSYYKLGKLLSKNFKNMYATLEGGYNIDALPFCIANFLDGINNKKQRFKEKNTKSDKKTILEYNKRIKKLDKLLKEYW